MLSADAFDRELQRVRLMLGLMLATMGVLVGALWRVQVAQSAVYRRSLDQQSMRRVRVPAARGSILDRYGVVLAENKPSYCIAIYVEELRQGGRASNTVNKVEAVVDELARVLGVKRRLTREDIARHIAKRCALPLLAWRDLDEVMMARWAEKKSSIPGVDIYAEPVRVYPQGSLAAHLLGYVGRQEPDPDDPYHFYIPDMQGKTGVEQAMNDRLAGVAGGLLIRVDALGFKHAQEAQREPAPGDNVVLTIDARIQAKAEEVLEGVKGAVVVIDPRKGDVLALASAPTYDPRDIKWATEFKRLSEDPDKPLFNRAVSGLYPPGSTFKPLVALAALESGTASPSTGFDCPGFFEIGGLRINCWYRPGHGVLNLRQAIAQSCNSYFCQLGLQCGYERILRMASQLGLGQVTGIELSAEAAGLLPDSQWKERVYGDVWRSGDTCNLAIGQGALLVTPLQMAVFAAALANGGFVYRPRLVLATLPYERDGAAVHQLRTVRVVPGELRGRMPWHAPALAVVRQGMEDAVESETGVGRRARIAAARMAGKTGTAEYGPRGRRKKYGWMIAYAPAEQPRYAVAMVVEEAESGGTTTAPKLKELMEKIFELENAGVLQTEDSYEQAE